MIHNIPTPPSGAYIPVWIDTYFTLPSSQYFEYILVCDGEEIFRGRAYVAPGESSASVDVNQICKNYLSSDITFLGGASTGSVYLQDAAKTFYLYLVGSGSPSETYKFYWNYDMNKVTYIGDITECVNGHYAPGMVKLMSYVDTQGVEVSWDKTGGNFGPYNTEACGDYAIYFLNRSGGWSSFLIEGKVVEKDNYTRSSFERKANQRQYYSREKEIYHSQITKNFEMHTGWMGDEESTKLVYNLLSTNKLYIHNLKTDEITPGNIVTSSAEYKNFNNSRRLVSYQIDIEESNKQLIL